MAERSAPSYSPLLVDAEILASRLPPLLIEAERVAATVALGVHGRRRNGPGESFWQFRRYQPGDSTGDIDWRQSARSDRIYVRETEWMAAQSLWLWVDGSESMNWHSMRSLPLKRERALVLGLALSALLLRGGERVGLLGMGSTPLMGRTALPRLAASLREQTTELPASTPPRHGHIVLISDFLMPQPEIEAALKSFSGAGLSGHILHLLDPAEEELPYQGRVRFLGVEGEGDLLAQRAEGLRDAYNERMSSLRSWLATTATALDWSFTTHRTDASPAPALLALHAALTGQ